MCGLDPHMLKFHYKKGRNETQTAKKNYDVYGLNAVSKRVAQRQKKNRKRCQSGNFNVQDAARSGRFVTGKVASSFEKIAHISSFLRHS